MADVTYDVSVELSYFTNGSLNTNLASAKNATDGWLRDATSKIGGLAGSVNSAFDGLAGSITGALGTAAAVGGGLLATGLGAAMKQGLSFASYKEDLVNGLAGTMSMIGNIPLDQGLKQASASAEHLRQLAIRLPGTFKNAADAFSYILPTGLGHGVAMPRLENMAAMGVGAAASLGIGQATAGHEMAALLEGRASGRMPLFAKMLGGDMKASDFNKLDFDKRFALIETKFNRLAPAMDQFGGSMSGLTSAAGDQAKNVASTFAAPLFGSIKAELARGLEWFSHNEDAVQAWAMNLGIYVDRAFHFGIEAIQTWGPRALTFAETVGHGLSNAFTKIEPYLVRFEGVAERFLQDPQAFDKIEHAALGLAAFRAGTGAIQMAAPMFGGLAGGEGAAGAGGLAELAVVAAPVAAGLAAVALAAYGAVDVLGRSDALGHNAAVDSMKVTAAEMTLATAYWSDVGKAGKPVADMFGLLAIKGVEQAASWVESLGWLVSSTISAADRINKKFDLSAELGLGRIHDDKPEEIKRSFDYLGGVVAMNASAEREKDDDRIKPPKVQVTNHNTIKIEMQTNVDPNRVIALEIDKHLNRMQALQKNPAAQFSR